MELNQAQLEELKALWESAPGSNFECSTTRDLEAEFPELATVLETYAAVGALPTTHDLSSWPLVDGVDCSPENVRHWIKSREAYRDDAVKLRGILNDVLEEVYNGATDALARVASIKEDMRS